MVPFTTDLQWHTCREAWTSYLQWDGSSPATTPSAPGFRGRRRTARGPGSLRVRTSPIPDPLPRPTPTPASSHLKYSEAFFHINEWPGSLLSKGWHSQLSIYSTVTVTKVSTHPQDLPCLSG